VSLIATHLNDADISVINAERVLYREPGFALLDDERLKTGNEAFDSARLEPRRIYNKYWSNLQTQPLADRRFQHLSAADLVARQLERIWQVAAGHGDRLVVAVPAYMNSDSLGLLLGIAAEFDVPIVAMVDAAVAATRRQYKGAVPVHVDLSLHSTTLTRIAQDSQANVDRSAVIDDSGILGLYDAWIRTISEAFVQQSRFDPLHAAETEQMMQDRLPRWLAAASSNDTVVLDIEYRGISHKAELESLRIKEAAAPVYQRIVSNLRALFRSEETPAIQLSDRAARMPGLSEMLKARVGGEVFLLEPGATARGLLARCRDLQRSEGGVSLVRQLPWDQSPVDLKPKHAARRGGLPTHLLFGNTAYAIDERSLVLGSHAVDGERSIDLKQDMPGVSRRHCVLQQENGQVVVRDYSRYGTFLNGHRIDGSAVLQIGDLVRLGTPGHELRLIAAEQSRGS
jgi:hypothetical protein